MLTGILLRSKHGEQSNIYKAVRMIKQDRVWEAKYVLFQEMMEDEWKAGHAKGLEEGHAKGLEDGRAEGLEILSLLIQKLFEAGRMEDIKKASMDESCRNQLLKEFGLSE